MIAAFHSIRARLALRYAAVFAILLGAFAGAVYAFLQQSSLTSVDEFLAETASAVAGAIEFERNAGKSDSVAVQDVVREFRLRETDVIVLDRIGDVAYYAHENAAPPSVSSLVTTVPRIGDIEDLMRTSSRESSTSKSMRSGGEPLRLYMMPYSLGQRALVIAAVQHLRARQRLLRETGAALLLAIPLLIGCASMGGYALARTSLEPVAAMSERASLIGASSLHERLPIANPKDELGRLAAVFNELLDRVERAFENQRRFMADASHELRTPVAVISGESELALSRTDRESTELRDALTVVRAESRRMRAIVDDLFLLAQSHGNARPLRSEEVYLEDLVKECARAAQPLATPKSIALTVETDDELSFAGDEALLKRMVMNLLDNAIKYTPEGGRVDLTAKREQAGLVIDVADSGPGVPPESHELIFERFYRANSDGANVRPADGAGLGLAIARWIARAHGGDVSLVRSTSAGSVFRVVLPAPIP